MTQCSEVVGKGCQDPPMPKVTSRTAATSSHWPQLDLALGGEGAAGAEAACNSSRICSALMPMEHASISPALVSVAGIDRPRCHEGAEWVVHGNCSQPQLLDHSSRSSSSADLPRILYWRGHNVGICDRQGQPPCTNGDIITHGWGQVKDCRKRSASCSSYQLS